jgi:hypothetical protein
MAGSIYDICHQCGFESADSESFSGDTVTFYNGFSEPGDFAQIIVGAPQSSTPEPATFTLLAGALLSLGAIRWLRRDSVS